MPSNPDSKNRRRRARYRLHRNFQKAIAIPQCRFFEPASGAAMGHFKVFSFAAAFAICWMTFQENFETARLQSQSRFFESASSQFREFTLPSALPLISKFSKA
jgi:hypothetical protein